MKNLFKASMSDEDLSGEKGLNLKRKLLSLFSHAKRETTTHPADTVGIRDYARVLKSFWDADDDKSKKWRYAAEIVGANTLMIGVAIAYSRLTGPYNNTLYHPQQTLFDFKTFRNVTLAYISLKTFETALVVGEIGHSTRNLHKRLFVAKAKKDNERWLDGPVHYLMKSRHPSSDSAQRMTENNFTVPDAALNLIKGGSYQLVSGTFFAYMLGKESPKLAAATALYTLGFSGLSYWKNRPLVQATTKVDEQRSQIRNAYNRMVHLRREIAQNGTEAAEKERVNRQIDVWSDYWDKKTNLHRSNDRTIEVVRGWMPWLAMLAIGSEMAHGRIGIGQGMTEQFAAMQLCNAINYFSSSANEFLRVGSALKLLAGHDGQLNEGKELLGKGARIESHSSTKVILQSLVINRADEDGGINRIINPINAVFPQGLHMVWPSKSGTGKTSLADTLKGLCPESEGLVLKPHGLEFQYISQRPYLSDVPVAELLRSPDCPRQDRLRNEQEIRSLLSAVGLGEKFLKWSYEALETMSGDQALSKLSGGQGQRLVIAHKIANRPKFLIADEPTAALDEGSTQALVGLMRQRLEGSTFILITHNQRLVDLFPVRGDIVDKQFLLNPQHVPSLPETVGDVFPDLPTPHPAQREHRRQPKP